MKFYLLAPHEAELIAHFRMLSEPTKDVVASLVASQSMYGRQHIAKVAELSLVP